MTRREPAPLPPELLSLTTGEAAAILKVSRTKVIGYCRSQKLRSFRTPGGHRRVLLVDVNALKEAP